MRDTHVVDTLVAALIFRVFLRIAFSVLVNKSRCVGLIGGEAPPDGDDKDDRAHAVVWLPEDFSECDE